MTEWHPDIPEEYRNSILTGDARVLSERIPDASVDLIITDPVYDRIEDYTWLAETAMRVLKPDSACLVYCAIGLLPEIHDAMRAGGLTYRWRLVTRAVFSMSRIFGRLLVTTQECLWYEKGKSKMYAGLFDCGFSTTKGTHEVSGANWGKGAEILSRYVASFSDGYGIVFDPFTGSGSIPSSCKLLGRNFIAFEVNPDVAQGARDRVLATQPPLFVPTEAQAAMWADW